MKRGLLITVAVLAFLGLTWVFPLFRIVALEEVAAARASAQFDAKAFAQDFWTKQLVPGFEQAADVPTLLNAIKADPEASRKEFGRSVGIGRVYLYFFRGEGTIVAVEKSGVAVSCVAPDEETDIVLKTGLLFGNTIRDSTGQLVSSNFANSQDFNAISKELNAIVERDVQPELKSNAKVGDKIRFVGSAEVRASSQKLLPLTAIPLQVEFPK
jgi:predicted lipoprotein